MKVIIFLSFIDAALSFTLAEARIFRHLREWFSRKNAFIGYVLSCGYCLGFWIAFILVAVYKPKLFEFWWLLDYFFTALVIAWLSAFQWGTMCWLMKITGK